MKKYKVCVYANTNYEIIEAEDEMEAMEEMWNKIMSYPDFYLEIVPEIIDEDDEVKK